MTMHSGKANTADAKRLAPQPKDGSAQHVRKESSTGRFLSPENAKRVRDAAASGQFRSPRT